MDMPLAAFCYALQTVDRSDRSDRAAAWERRLRQLDELNNNWVFRGVAVLIKGIANLVTAARRISLLPVHASTALSH